MDLILKLFDHTILPILTYSSEIWGYENSAILEKVHCEFLRYITKLRKSTPLYMLLAELGRYPVEITIKTRMIGFWNKIVTGSQNKLSSKIYQLMLHIPNFDSKWINCIKNIFEQTGRIDIWNNQDTLQCKSVRHIIKRILLDQHYQKWNASLQQSSKGRNYSIIKESIQLEKYFLQLSKPQYIQLLKFRTGNHYLPVEVGRWERIDHSQRKCFLCDKNDIGDEMHYLLICPIFELQRSKYIQRYYFRYPNIVKFRQLLTDSSVIQLNKLCNFVKFILDFFSGKL